jgi:hypothetical protein
LFSLFAWSLTRKKIRPLQALFLREDYSPTL